MYEKRFKGNAKDFGRVAVLYGGFSEEREISLQSGTAILQGLLDVGVDAFGVDVSTNAVTQLLSIQCDVAFIALHGAGGEDGKMQALLEWFNIPFTGSSVLASAVAMNKLKTKMLWESAGLPTPRYEKIYADTDFPAALARLGGACFIKPVNEGSSIGMRGVRDVEFFVEAYEYAAQFDREIIAESTIDGREFTVTILNGEALPSIELKAKNEFYDYEAKYLSDETEYLCPNDLDEKKEDEIRQLAVKAFSVLGCEHWGRVDFMQDKNEKFYLLEANTVPGMTSHSLVPMAAKAAGLSFSELLLEILVSTTVRNP